MKHGNVIFIAVFIVFYLVLTSCYPIQLTIESERRAFKHDFNRRIGKPMYYKWFDEVPYDETVYEKRYIGNGTTEWLLELWNECKIGVTIRDSDKVVLGWRYISNPDNCLLIYGGGL